MHFVKDTGGVCFFRANEVGFEIDSSSKGCHKTYRPDFGSVHSYVEE